MIVNVNVITEQSYRIEIDVPQEEEDKVFDELSCEPCMEDIMDVKSFFDEKGLCYETVEEEKFSRIETWR